jgi:hypothetical protein
LEWKAKSHVYVYLRLREAKGYSGKLAEARRGENLRVLSTGAGSKATASKDYY